jgi:hypothetical protein
VLKIEIYDAVTMTVPEILTIMNIGQAYVNINYTGENWVIFQSFMMILQYLKIS